MLRQVPGLHLLTFTCDGMLRYKDDCVRRNLKITLSYDGAEFRGWQIQPGLPTVQGVLADCPVGFGFVSGCRDTAAAGAQAAGECLQALFRSKLFQRTVTVAQVLVRVGRAEHATSELFKFATH